MASSYPTILLVEDEAIIAMAEKQTLTRYGYDVHHIRTGEQTVTAILENGLRVDLILMDIDLGAGIDGPTAASRILEHIDIPVVFLSSHSEPEIVTKTEAITSYGYIQKGVTPTALNASIKMALKLFQAKQEQSRVQEELRRSEQRYRALFENMNEEVHLWKVLRDSEGKITTWMLIDANPAALEAWGKTREDTIGKTADELWPDADPTAIFMPIVEQIFTEGRPCKWQRNFSGTAQILHMTSVPFGEYFFSTGVALRKSTVSNG